MRLLCDFRRHILHIDIVRVIDLCLKLFLAVIGG